MLFILFRNKKKTKNLKQEVKIQACLYIKYLHIFKKKKFKCGFGR